MKIGDIEITQPIPNQTESVAFAVDLKAGETLDGVGGYCAYGLIDNRVSARADNALPIALSKDCVLVNDVSKDNVVTFADVRLPAERISDRLWREQQEMWPLESVAKSAMG